MLDTDKYAFEEFANEVSIHEIIEPDFRAGAPQSLQEKIDLALAPLDDTFRNNTGQLCEALGLTRFDGHPR